MRRVERAKGFVPAKKKGAHQTDMQSDSVRNTTTLLSAHEFSDSFAQETARRSLLGRFGVATLCCSCSTPLEVHVQFLHSTSPVTSFVTEAGSPEYAVTHCWAFAEPSFSSLRCSQAALSMTIQRTVKDLNQSRTLCSRAAFPSAQRFLRGGKASSALDGCDGPEAGQVCRSVAKGGHPCSCTTCKLGELAWDAMVESAGGYETRPSSTLIATLTVSALSSARQPFSTSHNVVGF